MRCHSEDRFAAGYAKIKDIMEKDEPLWSKIASRMLMNVIPYPIEYARVLMQIGYEPIEPWPTTTLFGKPALGLPNVFQYIKYIKNVDGFAGCYRGLVPKLCAHTICAVAFDRSMKNKSIEFEDETDPNIPIDELEDRERDKRYVQEFLKNLIGKTIGIVLSHPFEVVGVRMMAQFVGRETKYVTLVGSFAEIYKENGIFGFFAGVIPRLIANASTLVIVSSSTYLINKYLFHDRELRTLTSTVMKFLATIITYPFLVVSLCMTVNNCGLIAGEPPLMPIYKDWMDCWKHLSQNKQLKRGSSFIWRYYTGPQILISNNKYIIDKSRLFFKMD